jgi:dipeptidyl-peptidase-4
MTVVSGTFRQVLRRYGARPDPPDPTLLWLGERRLRGAVLLPRGHRPGRRLPVLMLPYSGPHHQRVVATRDAYLEARWFADQGFAVVVADGRGTPGRGRAWEHAIETDLAGPVVADQVDALSAAAHRFADLDLDRVAIAGWSFGGYVALLAVLRRPDVFHAAIAGAPVVDWRWFDGYYAERYLGTDPDGVDATGYRDSAVLPLTAGPRRPLLIMHGVQDRNVPFGHSLALSAELTSVGWLHYFAPLRDVGHAPAEPAAAECVLRMQAEFLRRELGAAAG